jgi:DNA invertase Pin-like site-specific DNA recombinase
MILRHVIVSIYEFVSSNLINVCFRIDRIRRNKTKQYYGSHAIGRLGDGLICCEGGGMSNQSMVL